MKKRLSAVVTAAAILATLVSLTIAPTASAAAVEQQGATADVASISNTITGTTASGLTLNSTLSNMQFVNQRGQLVLQGVLNGTVTNAANQVVATITNLPISLPVTGAAASAACTILDLTLGPLHLNLLGLVVDLNQVHLTITGQTGPGNLLGNLLCGLANALNGGGGGLAGLLNRLLGL